MLDTKSLNELDNEQLEQLRALTDPMRLKLHAALNEPRTISEVAVILGVDRMSLYHHLQVLLKHDLVKLIETRRVKNLNESVYQAVEILNFIHRGSEESGPKEPYFQLIMNITNETNEDCSNSLRRGGELKAAASRNVVKIKKEDLSTVPKQIGELMREFMEKVNELHNDDGDVDYSVTVSHFEM